MPNWCNNKLVVSGPRVMEFDEKFKGKGARWGLDRWQKDGKTQEELKVLEEEARIEYENRELGYSLDALVPVPAEVIAVGYSVPIVSDSLAVYDFMDTFDPEKWRDGYSWCISHWGVKWDLHDVDMSILSDNEVEYLFDTAWSPPEPWLYKVANEWKDLRFELMFEEDGVGFAGQLVIEDGEVLFEETVDGDEYQDFVIEHFGYDPYEGMEEDV